MQMQTFAEYVQTTYFRKGEQEIETITFKKGNRAAEGKDEETSSNNLQNLLNRKPH